MPYISIEKQFVYQYVV